MRKYLRKKYIIITGGTSGIGYNLVKKALDAGAYVATNYHLNKKRAEKISKEFMNCGNRFLICKADVRDEREVSSMFSLVESLWPKIDILINNAGIISDSNVTDMDYEKWEMVINTNLNGTFLCSKYAARTMIKMKKGKILNIASIQGINGSYRQANYATSKAGMIGLTKSLAKELGQYNISINAFCPGHIVTCLNSNDMKKVKLAEEKSVIKCDTALNDLLAFVLFFCTDKINGVSGQVFRIDSRIL